MGNTAPVQSLRSRVRHAAARISGRRAQRLADAWRVAAALVAAPTLTEQLALLLEAAPRIGGADSATIFLRDEASGALRVIARYGYHSGEPPRPRRGGMTERVLATGRALVVDDTLQDPQVNPAMLAAGLRSIVALPLLVHRAPQPTPSSPPTNGGHNGVSSGEGTEIPKAPGPRRPRAMGVLYVNSRRPGAFSAEAVETLKGLAALATVAIENGRLLEVERATAERLADALRVREQFVSVASHELKAPLTPMKGYAQAIRRRIDRATSGGEPVDMAWLQRALSIMVDQIDRLDRLVTDLLDVSRLRAGRFNISPECTDLVALARRVYERFCDTIAVEAEATLPNVAHALRFQINAEALLGYWDPHRLDQLITNLVSNAIKYSPSGGTVELLLEPVDQAAWEHEPFRQHAPDVAAGWVHLAVRDEGIGLPPGEAAQAALFQAFSRGENAPPNLFSGFGLGLYICAEITRHHGGAIWAESAGAHRGTTFHVLLPPDLPALPTAHPNEQGAYRVTGQ